MVELMYVMGFFHLDVVLRELVHNLRQILADSTEDGYTNGEVRCPEQRLPFFRTHALHVVTMFLHPSCTTAYHLHVVLKGTKIIAICSLRSRKLYRYISTLEGLAVEVILIVDVDNTHNFMTTAQGYLLYHLTHFAVAD